MTIGIPAIQLLKPIDDLNSLMQIIVFIDQHDKGTISNFVKDLRCNQQPVYRTLERLEGLGILRKENGGTGTDPIYYFLTEHGKKMAKHFTAVANAFIKTVPGHEKLM